MSKSRSLNAQKGKGGEEGEERDDEGAKVVKGQGCANMP